jgi:PAS domain S-box-containing protein
MDTASGRKQRAFDELITRILARFATAGELDLDGSIHASLGEITEFVGVDYAFVIQFAEANTAWSATHEWCAPGIPSNLQNYQNIPVGKTTWVERSVLAGETVVVNSFRDTPPEATAERAVWESLGILSTLHLPFRGRGGSVKGCVAFNSTRREVNWEATDIGRLTLVCEAIANAIERARAEKELRESEARFRATFERAPVGILNVTRDGRLVRANQRFSEMLGYREEEVLGRHYSEFTHPDDLRATDALYANLSAEPDAVPSLEKRYRRKDGQVVWGHLTVSPVFDDVGGSRVMVAVIEDITARRQAEELRRSEAALRRAHEQLQRRRALAVAASLDGVWEWEAASERVLYSERFAQLLGYQANEVPQTLKFFRGILHPDDADSLWTAVQRHLSQGTPYDVECRLQTRSGEYRWFRTRGQAQRDADGRPTWMAGSLQDIDQQKTAETHLRTALAEVKRLTERLRAENTYLQEEITNSMGFDEIVGESELLRSVLTQIEHVAVTDASVLLLGETGTGKELLARAIHVRSQRKQRPLVRVNLAALPSSLIESELFGHVKGAFTGAVTDKIGRFQLADGGTLFLDEIGELDPELQTKLLRVLQEGEFERIGSTQTLRVDVRIVAATNRDLRRAMEENTFRSDLYYRLAVFPIEVPPLRLRRDDIPLLTWHFIAKKQGRLGKAITSIPTSVSEALMEYDWPGNIRELENVIERAMILATGPTLSLPNPLQNAPRVPRAAKASSRLEVDRSQILAALEACRWKVKGLGNAAERLGLKPSTLRYRMKVLGIERPSKS